MPAYRVLIVDDEQIFAQSLARLLCRREPGIVVTHAPGVDAAMAEIHVGRHDVVLTDVDMPDGTGFDLARQLRERGVAVALAFMSGLVSPERQREAASYHARLFEKTNATRIVDEVLALAAMRDAERLCW